MNGTARIVLLVVALAGSAVAQPSRKLYGWWDSPVTKELNLTDVQRTNIRNIVRSYRVRLIDDRATVQKTEIILEDLFSEDHFDPKRTMEAVERMAAARSQLTRTISEMAIRLRAELTTEQWHELERRWPAAPGPAKQGNPPAGR